LEGLVEFVQLDLEKVDGEALGDADRVVAVEDALLDGRNAVLLEVGVCGAEDGAEDHVEDGAHEALNLVHAPLVTAAEFLAQDGQECVQEVYFVFGRLDLPVQVDRLLNYLVHFFVRPINKLVQCCAYFFVYFHCLHWVFYKLIFKFTKVFVSFSFVRFS